MKTRICIALLLLRFLTVSPHGFSQSAVGPVFAQRLQDKIDSCVTHYDLPGISVSLLLPGHRYWNGASGFSHIYTMAPMDTTHLFQLASMTKMFVATTIFQLAEEGLLSIEDSVGTFLPPILNVPGSTKIKSLLNHRSGLYDFIAQNPASGSTFFSAPDSIWDHQLSIETYNDVPMFTEGSSFYYSNTNYVLLGMIIEEITGHSFAQELHDRFIVPYGLTQTFMPWNDSIAGPETPGWTSFSAAGVYDTDASILFNDCFASMIFTAGAMVATPKDVAKFTRLLHSGQLLQDTSLARMKQFTTVAMGSNCNGYGHGCMRYVFTGPKLFYGHAGDISGFTQFSAHNPLDSITLTISINRNNAPRGSIAQAILNVVYEELATIGMEEYEKENELRVYPNPVSDQLSIIPGKNVSRIELCNALGTVVQTMQLKNQLTPGGTYHFDTGALSGGMYLVRTINGDEVMAVRRVMVRK